MIRHMVMVRKKPETDEATVRDIMERLEGLYGEIRGLWLFAAIAHSPLTVRLFGRSCSIANSPMLMRSKDI